MEKIFGEVLKEIVTMARLSQRQFSAKAGISQNTLWRVFKAENIEDLNPTTIQGIAGALEMGPQELVLEVRRRMKVEKPIPRTDLGGIEGLSEVVNWLEDLPDDHKRIAFAAIEEAIRIGKASIEIKAIPPTSADKYVEPEIDPLLKAKADAALAANRPAKKKAS